MKRIFSLIALTAAMFAAIAVDAAALSENDAGIAASRWARRSRLGVRLSEKRTEVSRYTTVEGYVFYGVRLMSGTVFVADAGGSAKVLAFSRQQIGRLSEESPLYALISSDLAARAESFAEAAKGTLENDSDVDDLRVSPLLSTKWGQTNAYASENPADVLRCYNYYTPTLELKFQTPEGEELFPDETYESPCGCVATAMAQTFRYWRAPDVRPAFFGTITHPTTPFTLIGKYNPVSRQVAFENMKDWTDVQESVSRDPAIYLWDLMTERPLDCHKDSDGTIVWEGDAVGDLNCEAIGGLCYDCGVAAGLHYDYESTGLSIDAMTNITYAITNVFGYASAVLRDSASTLTYDPAERARAILANLDARRPAILLVSGSLGGHAIVADGYGFATDDKGILKTYVHLNMGWTGQCDIWYNLPDINVSENPERFSGFRYINGVVYNITPDPSQVGEVVSGRVTGPDGTPVANLEVEAFDATGQRVATATTGANGIYYFFLPPAAAGYDIFTVSGELVGDVATGPVNESCDDAVGNSWGNDMALGLPVVRVGARGLRDFRHAVEFAQRIGAPLVEVLRPCALVGDLEISSNLTIVATNPAPRQSLVVCYGGDVTLGIAAGARLALSNVVFSAGTANGSVSVDVAAGGVLAVSGFVLVDGVATADANGFEVAGPLENGIVLRCSAATGEGDVFGVATGNGADYAAYVFNGYDLELAGAADGSDLKWASGVPVPVSAAFAVFSDGSGDLGFRSFDQLVANVPSGSGEMHLRRQCSLTRPAVFSDDRLLVSDFDDGLVVDGGGFTVDGGATLTVSNLVIGGSADNPLFRLGAGKDSKGHLVLARGATIKEYANTVRGKEPHGGAVAVHYGSARLLAGASINGCSAEYAGLRGGGIFLKGYYSELELGGGTVQSCYARGFGGGVYVGENATVRVTGPSKLLSNVYRTVDGDKSSNIYFQRLDPERFVLGGDAEGGDFSLALADGKPEIGAAFMTVADTVDAETASNSASAFYIYEPAASGPDRVGAVSDDAKTLVWQQPSASGQCDPASAVYIVVYDSGETNYYRSIYNVFSYLKGDATIFVATNRPSSNGRCYDHEYYYDIEIVYNLKICTVEGAAAPAVITRWNNSFAPPACIFVRPGASLTISNLVVQQGVIPTDPGYCDYAAFSVDGGALTVEDGAEIVGMYQKETYSSEGSRAAGAVDVYNGGVFRMTGGAIRNCENYHWGSESDYSVGAGVLVDGGTAYFEGGSVTGCVAYRYAGVYIGNKGKAYVSGAFTAANSRTYSRAGSAVVDSNFAVQDLSTLVLTGPLSGSVGYSEGLQADTNIFGEVGCELTDEVIASATNFHHDVTGAFGAVATNSEGKAVLVWSSAFPAGEDSFEDGGVVYYRVAVTPPPPPPPVYTIHYVGGAGSTGTMEDTVCKYGKVYNLRKCTLSKSGSHFVGWAWNGRLYDDGLLIFNLSDVDGDELDFVAVWVAD